MENARGRPMRGPIAEDGMMVELLNAQGKRPWMVQQLFTVSAAYPYGPEKPGDRVQWTMAGTPMQLGGRRYLRFELSDCYCVDQQVVVQRDGQVMRIRVPNDPRERQPLVEAVQRRSGDHVSPEVFRFRPGTFTFAELAAEPVFDALEGRLAKRLEQQREAQYNAEQRALASATKQAERNRRKAPPLVLVTPPSIPRPVHPAELHVVMVPGIDSLTVARVNADTVWLRITGRVMLDGGCASNRPLFGIELWTDSGWVERLPLQHAQMDCGMPWADWRDHEVMLPPLRWWTGANQPAATRELKPGMYRVVLMGANRERRWTDAFEVR
ncbi:MAG: hypothetical protein JNJ64_08040 [Flavobacteriales bacterium]|nr:hypothetical protein [Flavobacteriales bacterium]